MLHNHQNGTEGTPKLLLFIAEDRASNTLVCLPLLDGPNLCGLSNYCSSLYGPLVLQRAAGAEPALASAHEAWEAIAHELRNHPKRWPMLTLSPMDTGSAHFEDIQTALKGQKYQVDTYTCFGNWYLKLADRNFDRYRQGLPSALRKSIERGERRLTKQGISSIQIQCAPDEHLEAEIANFVSVYAKSWKSPEPNPDFIPNLARMAARQGWLRLGVLKLENQAAAAQLWFVKGDKANIFKLAYVEGYERFSVGSVLTHALMKHCIDQDKVNEVDYLTGDDDYKKDWMSNRRERRGIVAFDLRTGRGLWAATKHFVGRMRRVGGSS